ncbi:hypothetical protein SETIT_8G166900v2 [Setaria italica]|uniref:Rx N-terminal domain-containing protein n=1 Tax=Setaria italica TaxID=4555 RepID=A0A368S8P4_SETIT|nr:hypothetical protein SETIT_8G166900v2 [Setaria italica]
MEATALSVGKSVLNGALGYAKSAFAEEVALQLGIQRDHAFVSDELEMMQSFLMEAHEERGDNKVVKTWVKQVRDTAYDVEDSLQDFAVRVERPSWWRFPRTLLERRRVAKKMKELRAKVEDVSQRNVRYRLIKGSGSKATAATEQSSIIAAAIFGVDDARRAAKEESQRVDLVQLINREDDDLRVIAVWGTGGDIGQTSIIRAAYKNPDTQSKFPSRAWVRVTHPFSSKGFVQSLVNQFLAVEGFKDILDIEKTAHNLVQEFDGYVQEKRFLIVLTDLCTIEEWDQIEKCLPNNNKGSRIIVSTTQVEVASLCAGQDSQASELKQLSADHTLYAFYDKVFGKAADFVKQNPEFVEEANQNLKKYGGFPLVKATDLIKKNPELFEETKKILKKCGGLPLAIVTIGGYLASRPKTRAEWRKLNENISAELEMNPELGMIRTVLRTSYDGLPYELKSCFLYLSIFPEDHIISQRRLVHRWTVEGYSHERCGKSANEMAENYFTQLKYRSMILPFQQSIRSRKSIDSCKVHDLIRDIAISKSMEENLVFRLEEGCGLSTHGAIRHLAISSNWKGDQSELERIVDLSRLRSLTVFGEFRPFYISDKMRLLRVLDLEDIDDLKYHQLDHIWKLVHLKYLSLRGCFRIDLLPESLGNLRQLQVLDVRGTRVRALPKTIIKLRKLQYIHAGRRTDYVTEAKDSLTRRCLWGAGQCATCCVPLLGDIHGPLHKALTRRDACTFACCVKFPAVMMGVDEERSVTVPGGTRKLKELHTLREVNVGRGNAVLQDIKMLTGLRKLGVTGINRKNGPAFRAAVSNLSRLESLSVRSAGKRGLRGCLDGISSPPENLQSLKLYGNLETLPEWIKELPHLVKLKLARTRLLEHDAAMEFLGNLAKLEILVLSWHWSLLQGEELDFKPSQAGIAFGSLRVLSFGVISKVKSVKFEQGAMPKLEWLQVTGVANNEICFSGLDILQSINEVQLDVYMYWRGEIITINEEDRRKKGELKKKIQEQLARNPNQPIVRVVD